jgi:hypothetical protein
VHANMHADSSSSSCRPQQLWISPHSVDAAGLPDTTRSVQANTKRGHWSVCNSVLVLLEQVCVSGNMQDTV